MSYLEFLYLPIVKEYLTNSGSSVWQDEMVLIKAYSVCNS